MGRAGGRRDGGGMEWCGVKEGGGAEPTHLSSLSPMSAHAHCRPSLFMLVVARVHSWAPAIVRDLRWLFWLVVVCMPHGLWVMMQGAGGHCRLWAVGSCHGCCCLWWRLVVVVLGWGGSFLGGCSHFCGRSVSSWSNKLLGVCWLVMWLAMSLSLSLLVAVVSRW